MDLSLAEKQVTEWAKEYAQALGLKGSHIQAKYIWNPGGFVNQSYRLSDGVVSRHVKFALAHKAPSLKQWAMISDYLADHYNAPRLVQEVTHEILPGYSYGLVFEFIEGHPLSAASNPIPGVQKVLKTLNRLHTDRHIQRKLTSERVQSYAAAFTEEYISRFEEDLQGIRSERHLLSFVTDDSIDWFEAEVDALRQIANQKPCFQKQATDVVHNDINWQNILINDHHDFWMIDWDELSGSGDAAMDYSVLLWPFYYTTEWSFWRKQILLLTNEETLERMELYFRAKHLDDVIDVLADYIEAESIPDVREMTQQRAKETHLRAYADYMRLYA
ncbi:aminoglycoside phosphotransferase family protein [Paenibacillus eucommiae]|uniref:Thiamine kinase-like enzyme n=1 Tax=Paenibacillus eucommiae TaxID=1355755 RepID=A0ABS4J1N8_9BACL|nr:aminoglycoside phosphotransferase family protein [Paenibacillus eucommiae]MBP1993754.1 thiamine kinase-like enzyme [Paenibacillus eucommiae]